MSERGSQRTLVTTFRFVLLAETRQQARLRQSTAVRWWAYNGAPACQKERDARTGQTLFYRALAAELTAPNKWPETVWTAAIGSHLLQQPGLPRLAGARGVKRAPAMR